MNDNERDLCLHQLFEEQARRSPRALALVDERVELTYEDLDRRAELQASYLRGEGVGPDETVGIYMERCAEYVVACLAALKAGGAFLPLELAYPESMIREVLADSGPRIVLTQDRYAGRLPEGVARVCVDGGSGGTLEGRGLHDRRTHPAERENLAFVSYSSGTTGKPKGIANPHRAAVRSYLWRYGIKDYGPGDRVACNVFFIWEMLRPLLRGATTVVVPDDVIYDPAALVRFLAEYRITEVLMTPSLLESVLDVSGTDLGERLADLRVLWLNGEVVTRTLARRTLGALPGVRALNLYSCSETHEVAAGDLQELVENPFSTYCPVGRPVDPEHLYIMDAQGSLVPDGEAGELYVGGDLLARGYVNRSRLTEESFLADPFSPADGARMYRSGDKARLLPDGNLEMLGRVDSMVKIRGYSVELGAVEAAIEDALAVRTCVVIAEGEEGEDKRLVAYLLPAPEAEGGGRYRGWSIDPRTGRCPEIRGRLRERLPHYAIPASFVELEALPIQATSGKVDLGRLPRPPARAVPAAARTTGKLPAGAPRSERETLLARIWEEVLRLPRGDVGPDDDFFDLGGHSLAAAQLSARLEETFGTRVSMAEFLEKPTVVGLCDRIEARRRGSGRSGPDLGAEAVLEPAIAPDPGTPRAPAALREAESVFLTGATGFLGAFLLDGLLSRTEARVCCLVRPRDGEDPMAALRENLERYELLRPSRELDSRVVPVAGDLEEPLLGLSPGDFDGLAREVDAVIHAGARVNLVYPYSALAPANVGGTREVLRLACRHKTKPLHHVSTNGIFPPGGHLCREDADLDALKALGVRDDGYGQTKWVAEKLVREAAGRGLPVRVYRPGNVSGHSATGASNPRDLLGAMIADSIRLGLVPDIDGWRVEMTPVDFVAGAILTLADEPRAVGGVFHLANPDPPAAEEVFSWLRERGYDLEPLPYPEWASALREAPGSSAPGGAVRGFAPGEGELWDGNTYDDDNTRRALRSGGPRRPEIDGELLGRYVRYFVRQGWVEAPAALSGGRRQ